MAYIIDLAPCINCGLCRFTCPTDTIKYFSTGHRTHVINQDGCIDCDLCAQICPMQCIHGNPQLRPSDELLEAAKEKARGRARADRATLAALDDLIKPFVGSASGVNLALEYDPDANRSN